MLGKLLKHEFKAVNRLLIPIHLVLIVITIVGRFYIQFVMAMDLSYRFDASTAEKAVYAWQGILNVMLVLFYIIALSAVLIITSLYLCVLRPRKNLFSDEGYLMHTLPVSSVELIFSKLIVAVLWLLIDGLLLMLSVFIMVVNKDVIRAFPELLTQLGRGFYYALGVRAGIGIPLYLLLGLVQVISSVLLIYMCIAVGHSFNDHKILSSIGIYVGVSILRNLISSIFMVFTANSTSLLGSGFLRFFSVSYYNATPAVFWSSFLFSLFIYLLIGIGSFLLANYSMTKRLNLE